MGKFGQLKRWLVDPEPPGVGIEFRPGEIVMARFDDAGEMDLCLRAPLPHGVVDFSMLRPNLMDAEALGVFLQKIFDEAGVKGGRVGVTLPDMLARISLVQLPTPPRSRSEAVELLRFRLKKSLPFDAEEARITYQAVPGATGTPSYLTGIMHDAVASQYERLFADLGFHVGVIETSSLSLLNLWETVVSSSLQPEQDYFFLNLEETYFTVSLIRNLSRLALVRTVGHRSPMLDTEALDFRHKPSYEAESLLRELLPTLIYYQEKLQGNSLAHVYYRSLRPDLGDLADVLEDQFGVPAQPFELSRAVKVGSHLTVEEPLATLAGAASGVARGKAA